MNHTGNFTFDWCLAFVEALATNGVKHAIISPGSRSTPLTLAFAAHPDIKKTVVLDERSAAFMALGIGKITGTPAAIVCTSGTAVANYYPAVVEASMSEIPLLILTTDRPPYLRSVGASQAIDQFKIFNGFTRFFFETGEPVNNDKDMRRLRLLALQAFRKSIDEKGPLHINFAFRKPLEPAPDHYRKQAERLAGQNRVQSGKGAGQNTESQKSILPSWLIDRIGHAKRPVIIAGRIDPTEYGEGPLQLARQINGPLLAEAHSQLSGFRKTASSPFIYGFDSFLKNGEIHDSLQPDLILRFGNTTISVGLDKWLKKCRETEQYVISTSPELRDPTLTASDFCTIASYDFEIDAIPANSNPEWLSKWLKLSNNHRKSVQDALEKSASFTDGHVHNLITPQIPDGWLVMLSNSFPVRDFDLFGYGFSGNGPVIVNRGASGIDGVMSTFFGASLASGRDGILLTGDLAFLHDTNALLSSRAIPDNQTLVIVVLNNNGGNIFRMLPISGHTEVFSTYFETPQGVDLNNICKAYGIGFQRVDNKGELLDEFKRLTLKKGIHVIECVTNAADSMNLRLRLNQ